jgi:hypothetical protein
VGQTTQAQEATVRIDGVDFSANGKAGVGSVNEYTGPCPVQLKFGWSLQSTAPTTATYSFVRNDGGHSSSTLSVNIPKAKSSVFVYEGWKLGANIPKFLSYTGWVQLTLQSPNSLDKKIGFTIHCK